MESANLSHQHQHQEQFGGSSSIALPSLHGADSSHPWNQNLIQNGGNYSSTVNGVFLTSRDLRQSHEGVVPPSINISMFQGLGSHWASSADNYNSHSTHEPHLSKVKAELSEYFPKYSNQSNLEEIHLPSTSYIKHEQQYLQDLNEKLLLRSFSANGFQNSTELYPSSKSYTSLGTVTPSTRGSFSRIHPSATISGPNPSSSPFLGSLGLNIQATDLLASARLGSSFTQPSISSLALLRETVPFGYENIREPNQDSSNCCSHKISFLHGAADAKRPSGFSDSKASQSAPKKPRFESRTSFPPFKVRKEKLGDRIAALQQLVAPFGKTDTASVLMEAIGYIKFLQEQVETLSVPYMKSSGKPKRRSLQGGSGDEDGEEPKRDLGSRGLCLVPLSCTSYVTNDTASVWSPPNFTGGN
ncbi:transcription factor bHLH110-like [Aristolochia californica]|uniref:transcription factor bHLH110-like n=1 Tax=Aristolochia californica TaxID=171875 RepID=UPI0035DB7530